MDRLFWMTGLAIYVLGILMFNPTTDVVNAQVPTCTGSAQTNAAVDGQHPPGAPATGSTPGPSGGQTAGSCSVSTSARAGQLTNCGGTLGACHFNIQTAFSGPPSPPNTATCASTSAGPSGTTHTFADGSTQNGFCTQGVHSP